MSENKSIQLKILNCQNQEVGEVDLPPEIFGLIPRPDILSRVVTWQLAKRRQGSHKVKTRSEVSGTTKKMCRQKGTGGARHGSKRGAQFRGGGIIFGPLVRSHEYSLQKKVKAMGLKMALSAKAQEGNLIIFNNFAIDAAKTKIALNVFSFLEGKTALLVDGGEVHSNIKLAISALKQLDALPAIGANVYDILKKDKLVLSLSALEALKERFL